MKNNYSINQNLRVKFKQTRQTLFLMLVVLFFSGKTLAQNFELVTVSSVASGSNTNNALFVASSPTIPSLAFIRAQRVLGPEDGRFTISGDDIRYTSTSTVSGIPNNLSRIRFTFLQADGLTPIPVNDFRFIINDIDGPNNEALGTDCGASLRFSAVADPTNLIIDNVPPDLSATGSANESALPPSRVMYEYNDVTFIEFDNYANSGYLKDFDMDNDLAISTPIYAVCLGDVDNDGVTDDLDLDDDNDGILDVIEAGGNDPNGDHDGDGLPNFLDVSDDSGASATYIANADGSVTDYTDANSDGVPDVFEASSDSDSDPNHLDSDSDNDGCPDSDEVYGSGTDSDGNGYYGAGIPAVDANGLVIAAGVIGSTYGTLPSDNDTNGTDDYLQASMSVTGITTQPTNATITAINNATFNVVPTTSGTGTAEQYQWQEDSGSGFVNITDGGVYSGATTATLTVSVLNSSLDGNSYRALITTLSIVCDPEAQSNAVILTVTANLIEANDDLGTVNEGVLSVAVANVLVNDNLGGSTPTVANVTLSEISSTDPGVTLNTATGEVNVAATTIEGVYTLVYQICETTNITNCSTATVTVTVTDAGNPIAVDDSATTTENTLVTTGNVLTNDSVVDGATITSSDAASANGGTVVDNGNGTFNYTPPAGFIGTDTFTYTLCDNDLPVASCSTATVTVTVTDAGNPTAVDDNISITEDTTIATVISALSNDSLIDGATYSSGSFIYTGANGATIVDNNDGTFDYTPALGFSGLDSFSYTICDNDSPVASCSTATVFVTVLDEGNPFAVNDTATTILNTPVITGNVLINDTVIDNATITSFDTTSTNGGIVADNGGGTFSYTPPVGFIGIDTFTYTLCDDDTPASCSTATVTITVEAGSSDLVTGKSVSVPLSGVDYVEGETIIYTLTVTNNGPDAATGVSLTDLLPAGITYVSDDGMGAYNSGSGLWAIGNIANGATSTLNITATVDVGTGGLTITNTTTAATGDQSDPGPSVDDLDEPITVNNDSDVVLTKVVDNSTPNEGDTVTYTITATNNGQAEATSLVVTDTMDPGLTFVSATPSSGTYTNPAWTIGNLANGQTETLTITATVDLGTGGQTLNNSVINTQDQTDPNPLPAGVPVTVTSSDLATTKTVDNSTPNEGATIVYTLTVTNNGPDAATGVSLVDNLPLGVSYFSHSTTEGTFNSGSGVWTIGNITNGGTETLNITATVDAGTGGQIITNVTTAASGDQSDPDVLPDDLDESITVIDEADIVLTKVVDNSTPDEGDTVTYTVTVTNNGLAAVTNLVVTDALPAGLTYGTVIPSIGTWTVPAWNIGTLESGATESITIEAIVGLGTRGLVLTNVVSNTQDQIDSNLTPDDDSETITVTSVDLITIKTVNDAAPNEGDLITYTITVTNALGGSDATNVNLIDVLPVGVTYASHSTVSGTYNTGSGLWTIGDITSGNSAVLTINATVDAGTVGQTIVNTTTEVMADQADYDTSNNIGSVAIIPVAIIDLSLTKTVIDDVINPEVGDVVTFEIRVSNDGPTEASGVQVTDLTPSGYDFVNYSSSIGTYNPLTGLWDIGVIEIGNTAILLVDVIVLDTGDYLNCAEVTAANEDDVDSTPGNGLDTEDDYDCAQASPIQEVDLAIEKTVIADNLNPLVNTEVTFEIRLVNNGDIDATEVIVTDLLPSGYTFLNYSSTRGTYEDTDGTWNIGTIVNGETEVLLVDAIVNATGDYLNCATITNLHQIDINAANNTSCIATSPISVIDLELTKDVDNLEPYAENNVDFTINLTNNGPSDAAGVVVADLLPSGYTFVSYSSTTGTYDDGSGLWNVGSILNGNTETLTVTAYVLPIGDWTNVAEVIAANELDLDSTPGNNDIYEDDQAQVTTDPIVLLTVPEGFSPDGDGINDTFEIEFLEVLYPNFSMEIVNRYGNKVFEYEHDGNPNTTPMWWDGFSTGRWNMDNLELPVGTYFYTIYFNNDERKPQTGWVYLRR